MKLFPRLKKLDSNDNFHRLDRKYHTVSEDLKGIRRAVERRLVIEEDKVQYSAEKNGASNAEK